LASRRASIQSGDADVDEQIDTVVQEPVPTIMFYS